MQKIFLIISINLIVLGSWAQNLEQSYALGNEMYAQGLYSDAIEYYQRVLYFDNGNYASHCYFKLANAYLQVGDFENALKLYDLSYQITPSDSLRTEMVFKKALLYIKSNNASFAMIELLSLPDSMHISNKKRQLFFLGSTWFLLDDYSASKKAYFEYLDLCERPEDKLRIELAFQDTSRINRIKPNLVGILSLIIPGAGQLVAGNPKEALNSLLLVGSLDVVFIMVARRYSLLDAYMTVFPWMQRYYAGGFNTARRLARQRKIELREELYQKLIRISVQLDKKQD